MNNEGVTDGVKNMTTEKDGKEQGKGNRWD